MKELLIELARSLAYHEGRRELFDMCQADEEAEDRYGHYEGYLSEAESLLARCPKLYKALSVSLSGATV